MNDRNIILSTGATIPFNVWDTGLRRRDLGTITPHVSTAEVSVRDANGEKQETGFTISEVILTVFEAMRSKWRGPLEITSGYRTPEKQALLASNPNAATYSPHQEGMALDIGATSPEMVDLFVDILRSLRHNWPIRIGWKKYRENGFNFVHVDVCPFYFGKNGPWAGRKCPDQWRELSEW